MRDRRRFEEHPNHERWLVSYADFMTLLFALFVVLFASSHHDKTTIVRVSKAVKHGFQVMQAFSNDGTADKSSFSTGEAQPSTVPANAGIDMVELQKKLHHALGKEIERQEVELRMTPEGFVISLHELGFFDSGQAQLTPDARGKVKRIAEVLMQFGLNMRVEGHTDDVPIHTDAFPSNWELSTARAMAVAMMLLNESGFDPQRLSIAGYGQYHPASSNDTPEGRKSNRRVDIVVVSTASTPAASPH